MSRLMLALVFVSTSIHAAEKNGTKYALLIGVSKYDPTQLHDLAFAEKDVTELAKTLIEKCGYSKNHVFLMTQTEGGRSIRRSPTAKNIRRLLIGLINLCDKEDTLLIAFAGHGIQFVNESANYFCPADADLGDKKTLIDLQKEVYLQLANDCDARVKLLFVDACRNDPRTRASRSRREVNLEKLNSPQKLKLPKGLAAFFSCQAGQESFEDETLKHGVFFHFLIKGLQGEAKNRDGNITLPGLQEYVYSSVKNYVFRKLSNRIQKPQLKSSADDIITLVELKKVVVQSPEEVFKAVAQSVKKLDYRTVMTHLTKASQSKAAAAFLGLAAQFDAIPLPTDPAQQQTAKAAKKAIAQLLKKVGVKGTDVLAITTKTGISQKKMIELLIQFAEKNLRDPMGFVGEFATVLVRLSKQAGIDLEQQLPDLTVKNINISGDTATGTVVEKVMGKESSYPVQFKKENGKWKLVIDENDSLFKFS